MHQMFGRLPIAIGPPAGYSGRRHIARLLSSHHKRASGSHAIPSAQPPAPSEWDSTAVGESLTNQTHKRSVHCWFRELGSPVCRWMSPDPVRLTQLAWRTQSQSECTHLPAAEPESDLRSSRGCCTVRCPFHDVTRLDVAMHDTSRWIP